ncbi:MAG: hypothetical protein KAI29_04155, partial [Cyclobacteriaceae bacterium]|nr:hypothetical protein [Cyclobacteriaceae bacterium]
GVNIASRIQSIADPGGIYISESIQKAIRVKSSINTKYIGELNLKNVDYLVKTYAIQGEGLPVPSPSKIKKLVGRSWEERILRSAYTYIIILALLLSNGWWIRNAYFINTSQISSLLVLPFDNFTGSDTLDYHMAGMHSALIGDLGRISKLRVPSKTTANAFKNAGKSIPDIASEQNINYFLEPSVLCLGDTICLQVKLISAFPEEKQIWMHDYKVERSQILNMYNLVSKEIFERINITLTPGEEILLAESRTVNPDAQEAYFRGMSYWELGTKADLDKALDYFQLARDIDPDYALAYLGISKVWGGRAMHGFMSSNEARAKGEIARKKALELDSTLVEIRTSIATGYTWGSWEWERAGKEYRRVIEINPNYAFAQAYYSHYLAIMGDAEAGLPHGELAIKLDPFNTLYQSVHGQALKNARKYDEALDLLQKLYAAEPDQGIGLPAFWAVYHELGDYDKALEIAKNIYALKGMDHAVESLEKGNREGGYKMAMQRTAEVMIAYSDTTYIAPWQICTLYCRAEMKEEAMSWLEKTYEEHDSNMPYISVDPLFDFLRAEDRFKNILRKMNLPY